MPGPWEITCKETWPLSRSWRRSVAKVLSLETIWEGKWA